MARETKVGLLAGLAFIVGFAIILTHRGREGLQVNRRADQANVANNRSNRAPGSVPVHRLPPSYPANRRTTARSSDPSTINDSYPASPAWSKRTNGRPNRATRQRGLPATRERSVEQVGQSARYADSTTNLVGEIRAADDQSTGSSSPIGRDAHVVQDKRLRQLELRIAELSGQLKPPRQPQLRPRQAKNAASKVDRRTPLGPDTTLIAPRAGSTYVVAAGDTLSKIAQAHYGSSSQHYIDLIVQANRGVLSDPNVVRVGDELSLPTVRERQQIDKHPRGGGARVTRKAMAKGATRARPSSNQWRWYEIKKNDRYISIAREQLGDARRWPEIYKLNRDKFADPSHIREGVRIKIPTVALVRSGQRQHP